VEQSDSIVSSLLSHISANEKELPPVETWNPPYCGEMDIIIKASGDWIHNNSPIGRKKLFKLFSTILLKQNDEYFLVTPVEKVKIQVDWQPFVITDFELVEHQGLACFRFTDNCDNQVMLVEQKQLAFSQFDGLSLPVIRVRRNLFASFSRSCYYRLIEQSDIVVKDNVQQVLISSNGQLFCLGKIS